MKHRYLLIEPKYSDPDTFCRFTVGSEDLCASIQIYADFWILKEVASALIAPVLTEEWPSHPEFIDGDGELLFFYPTVLPHEGNERILRFRIFNEWVDDGAPYRIDLRFNFCKQDAVDFADDLRAWCAKPEYTFVWKGSNN